MKKKELEVIPLENLEAHGGAGGVHQCTPDNPSGKPGKRTQQYASEYRGGRNGSLPGASGDGSRYPRSRQDRYSDLARRTMRMPGR